jgi:lipopolysaccharide/colanic/teichoic acid biosynthesis glycosyltransferase
MRHNSSLLIDDKIFKIANQAVVTIATVPLWKKFIKRLLDIVVSISGLILLMPLMIFIAIKIKLDSKGSIFYCQQRIGYNGTSFVIFKFRSMYMDAEKRGPELSFVNDRRITTWGKTIRKWKFDELPQLLNILMGHMSLVGPRPERKFYIDMISIKYPYYKYLHQVKPGLTSLGMIKFGYAENIEQIIQRMRYEITYIENYSLGLDLQIIYYTLYSIIEGKRFDKPISPGFTMPRIKVPTLN